LEAVLTSDNGGPEGVKAAGVLKSASEKDINLRTGPHLGNFNCRISLPELISFFNMASACCIAGR